MSELHAVIFSATYVKVLGLAPLGVQGKKEKHVFLEGIHSFHLVLKYSKSVEPFSQKLLQSRFGLSSPITIKVNPLTS